MTADLYCVSRIDSLAAIEAPGVRGLIGRAVEKTRYPGTTPKEFVAEIWSRIEDPALGVFVGRDRHKPKALCIAHLPVSAMMMAPQVVLAYNGGAPQLTRLVGMWVAAWLREHGHDRFLGMNLWYSDALFMKVFRFIGEPRRIASWMEFKI